MVYNETLYERNAMKFDIRKTNYDQYEVRLTEPTRRKLHNTFLSFFWLAVIAVLSYVARPLINSKTERDTQA